MNGLSVIRRQEILGKPFTLYGDFENPLFLAKEVAEWIGYSDVSTMIRTIDEDRKSIKCTFGGNQKEWFLTEYGVYEVLTQSRKPIAKRFKKEFKAVLKSIRLQELQKELQKEFQNLEFDEAYQSVESLYKFIEEKYNLIEEKYNLIEAARLPLPQPIHEPPITPEPYPYYNTKRYTFRRRRR